MTSFYDRQSEAVSDAREDAYLWWQGKNFALDAPQEVRSQTVVQLLDQVFGQFFVFGFQRFEIAPVVGIEEVHEVEELANIVIQWGASHDNSVLGLQLVQLREQETLVVLDCI